jgi:hypothetical protein
MATGEQTAAAPAEHLVDTLQNAPEAFSAMIGSPRSRS